MKITRSRLRRAIKEESQKLLNEEPSDYYRDYRNGSISYEEYQQMVKDYESRTGGSGSRNSNYRPSSRKTSYVGSDANADQIAAVEAALSAKPNNFLTSVLDQLKNGRGLSGKQKSIVKSIIKKTNPNAAAIFETRENKTSKLSRKKLSQAIKMVITESAAEQLLNLPQNPTPQDVYNSVRRWMIMHQDPSTDPDAALVDSVIANVMVKNQIRKDDEHIGSKLNILRRILDPDKARRQSYRQGIESEMRELDPTGKKQKYGYETPSSLRIKETKMKITKRQLRNIVREAINEAGVPSSSYGGNYGASSHGGGYREYDRQRRSREYEMEEEYTQGDDEKEILGRLHADLRKLHQQNPDEFIYNVHQKMDRKGWIDGYDGNSFSVADAIDKYWAILQS